MSGWVVPGEVPSGPGADGEAARRLREAGLTPRSWGNGPGAEYTQHRHDFHKILYCVEGSITFQVDGRPSSCAPATGWSSRPGRRTRRR